MKVVLSRQPGRLEDLEYSDFPTPEPESGEASIPLYTAALNRMDMMVRNGRPGLKPVRPHVDNSAGPRLNHEHAC